MILAVDLAARFSAGTVMGEHREVHFQFDSMGRSPLELCALIVSTARMFNVHTLVIEDVPYGIKSQFMVKPVIRLQGMLIGELIRADLIARTLFVAPATWQRAQGVWRGKPQTAPQRAEELGYTPPDLLKIYAALEPPQGPERTKFRSTLRKARTDYIDSFLMADWALTQDCPLTDLQGVQRATTESGLSWSKAQTPLPTS